MVHKGANTRKIVATARSLGRDAENESWNEEAKNNMLAKRHFQTGFANDQDKQTKNHDREKVLLPLLHRIRQRRDNCLYKCYMVKELFMSRMLARERRGAKDDAPILTI